VAARASFVRGLSGLAACGLALLGLCHAATADVTDWSVVTSVADVENDDKFVSLREALNAAKKGRISPDASGRVTITFGDAFFENSPEVTVSLTNTPVTLPKGLSVVLQGRTDRKRVVLAATSPTNECRYLLKVEKGASLELRDLTVDFKARRDTDTFLEAGGNFAFSGCRFNGTGRTNNGYVVSCPVASEGSRGEITACSFVGARMGRLDFRGTHDIDITSSTFVDVDASANGDVVRIAGTGRTSVLDCTFTGCAAAPGRATLWIDTGGVAGRVLVGNTVVVGNSSAGADIVATSANVRFDTVFCGTVTGDTETNCVASVRPDELFDGRVVERWVGGVWRAYRPLAPDGAAYRRGTRVSSLSTATSPVVDILKRPVTGNPSPGSWATRTDADWSTRGVFVVNSGTDDETADDDGILTLRDALRYAQVRNDLCHEDWRCGISFADGLFANGAREATVNLQTTRLVLSNGVSVTVCGRTDARRLTLAATPPSGGSLLRVAADASLELRDLTVAFKAANDAEAFLAAEGDFVLDGCRFNGTGTKNGYVVQSPESAGGRRGEVLRCSFVGDRAGVLSLSGKHCYDIACSTFANVNASAFGAVVKLTSSVQSSVVNCTFAGCTAKSGAAVLQTTAADMGGRITVGNTIVAGSGSGTTDIHASDMRTLLDTVFYGTVSGGATKSNCVEGVSANIFSGGVAERWVGGVLRAFRPLDPYGAAYGKGRRVARARIGDLPSSDILRRPVSSKPSPGSWATNTDADGLTRGDFVVTSASAGDTDDEDGVVSFRDAVRYAQERQDLRDDDWNCRISFSPEIFPYDGRLRLKSGQRQLDILAFADGCRLSIVGPSDGTKSVTLDGVGLHRLVQVGAGNEVSFSNLTFANGFGRPVGAAGTSAGGGVGNAGRASFDNCAFVNCVAGDASVPGGWSNGGGLATLPGGTSSVVRCSFSGCTAACGGGLVTQDGGVSHVLCTTFSGNVANGEGTALGGFGGGVAACGVSETVLAQVTLAGNRATGAGGGLATQSDQSVVRLANVLAVGNEAGSEDSDDLSLSGAYFLNGVRYGRGRLQGDRGAVGPLVLGGCSVGESFADVRNGMGEPVSTNFVSLGVTHVLCRIASEIVLGSLAVWADGTLANVACGTNDLADAQVLCGTREGLADDSVVTEDEVGQAFLDQPFLGATWYSGAAAAGQSTDPAYGPLTVAVETPEALVNAIAKAKADPSLAVNGSLRITFAAGVQEIEFDRDLVLADDSFPSVPLKIVGPVTFSCASGASCRFLTVGGGNRLLLDGVTFEGGQGEEIGGAVYVFGASSLEAANCVFRGNTAVASAYGSWGGAVALEMGATGAFSGCAFADNQADEGKDIYREGTVLSLYGCSGDLPGSVGGGDFHARVEKPSGRRDWFDSLATAVADCAAGDRLVILDREIDTQAADGLPLGVTVDDKAKGAKSAAFLSSAVTALTAKTASNTASNGGTACYAVRLTETGVVCSPTTEATPTLEGAGIDLAGDADAVTVAPGNVKAGLTYGLGHAETPQGPFSVDEWKVAAPDEPLVLTAPKQGATGYYRVLVR